MQYKNSQLIMVFLMALAAVGCGKNKLVKDVDLRTHEENGDSYLETKFVLDTGGVKIPAFSKELEHPKHPGVNLGKASFAPGLNGGGDLVLDLNVSSIAKIPESESDGKLPNGEKIPVGGLGDTPVLGFPIGKGKVYVALDRGKAVIGAALVVKEFDRIAERIGGAGYFFQFNIGKVNGLAGVFTGNDDSQSGIALFIDASGTLNGDAQMLSQNFAKSLGTERTPVYFIEQKPSSRKERVIMRSLDEMGRQRKKVRLL